MARSSHEQRRDRCESCAILNDWLSQHMAGEKITILERLKLPGGALDGIKEPEKGFVIGGGREMEDHFECLWDLFRSDFRIRAVMEFTHFSVGAFAL